MPRPINKSRGAAKEPQNTRLAEPGAVVVRTGAQRASQVTREPLVTFLRRGMREISIDSSTDEERDVDR